MPKRLDAGIPATPPKTKTARTRATPHASASVAPKKPRIAANGHKLPDPIPPDEILVDVTKKQWRLGKSIGVGGFGEIYIASDDVSKPASANAMFVVKIEPHDNGPLFTEMHFYNRVAKPEMIDEWKAAKKLKSLGMPKYVAFGSHERKNTKYRFLVMERFGDDLQKLFLQSKKRFSLKTVLTLGIKILHVLEYIHSKGYIHADIKGSNLLLGFGKEDEVYLVDFGLACKYVSEGKHKPYSEDPRKAHDGTIEFTSRDAHVGAHSRRGDLEILGYNMVQWMCGRLPWEDNLADPQLVAAQKNGFMQNIPAFLKQCYKNEAPSEAIESYLKYVVNLGFEQEPNYDYCRKIFADGLRRAKLKNDGKLELAIKASPNRRRAKPTLEHSENDTTDSTVPAKQARNSKRHPCGPAQINRLRSKSQESLINKKASPPNVDNPTPAMLQVMQRRQQLQLESKKNSDKSHPRSKATTPPSKQQAGNFRRLRRSSSQSSRSSPRTGNNSLSPELF